MIIAHAEGAENESLSQYLDYKVLAEYLQQKSTEFLK